MTWCQFGVEDIEKREVGKPGHPCPIGWIPIERQEAVRCIRMSHIPSDGRWHWNHALKRRQNLQPAHDVQVGNEAGVGDHPDHG